MREAPSAVHVWSKEEQWQLDRIKSDKHSAQTKEITILRRNQYNGYRCKPANAVQLKVTHYGILHACTMASHDHHKPTMIMNSNIRITVARRMALVDAATRQATFDRQSVVVPLFSFPASTYVRHASGQDAQSSTSHYLQ